MKMLFHIFSCIFLFPLVIVGVKIHSLPLKFKDGILTDVSRLLMKVGDKLEIHCPEKMHFTLYKVDASMGEACIVPAHSTQIVAICKPGITGKAIIRSSTVGRMMKATFIEGEDGYIISVNSGLDEKTKTNNDENQYGGLCLKSNLKIPFSIVSDEKPKIDSFNEEDNDSLNNKLENFMSNTATGLPDSNKFSPSEDRNTLVQRQSSIRIPSDRFKYSSINEDGKFINANKEAKVERYMVDKVKLYLDVKAAIDNNPNLKTKTKVAFAKVENYFRGLIQFTEKEIRDLIELFELHQDSDYDIGYEELTRDSSGSGTTIIIISLLAAFIFLTGLTIIIIVKHLKHHSNHKSFNIKYSGKLNMTQFLPEHLLGLFFPRPQLVHLAPISPLLVEKDPVQYSGMAQYLSMFEDPKDTPSKEVVQTKEEKKADKRKKKEELLAFKLEQEIAAYHTKDTTSFTEDPFKTLFVCRLSYETTESKLRREFSKWGTIVNIKIVCTKDDKPRGYAFIEYSRKSEMSQAYKEADGIKIDGVRVLVDYERGRTRKDWLPRRLGGGKGKTRIAIERKPDEYYDEKTHVKTSSSHNGRRDDRYYSRYEHNDRNQGGYHRSGDDRRFRDDRRDYDDRRKKYDRNNDFRRPNNKFDDNNRNLGGRNYKSSKDDFSNNKRSVIDGEKNGPPAKRFYNDHDHWTTKEVAPSFV